MSFDSSWILSFSSATSSWPFICWTTLTLAVGFWIRPVRRVVGASPRTMIDVPSPVVAKRTIFQENLEIVAQSLFCSHHSVSITGQIVNILVNHTIILTLT